MYQTRGQKSHATVPLIKEVPCMCKSHLECADRFAQIGKDEKLKLKSFSHFKPKNFNFKCEMQ